MANTNTKDGFRTYGKFDCHQAGYLVTSGAIGGPNTKYSFRIRRNNAGKDLVASVRDPKGNDVDWHPEFDDADEALKVSMLAEAVGVYADWRDRQ